MGRPDTGDLVAKAQAPLGSLASRSIDVEFNLANQKRINFVESSLVF